VRLKLPPSHPDHGAQLKVLRAVAMLELAKGLAAIVGCMGIIILVIHRDPWDVASSLLDFLHISPDRHLAQVFLDWADTLTDKKLWAIVAAGLIYSTLRFIEGYGLWKARAWAEWLALITAGAYVPFELYRFAHKPNLFHVMVIVVNVAIVLYMAYLRVPDKFRREELPKT
jgi:uncharacterized membrane protein (DUF2068 family)